MLNHHSNLGFVSGFQTVGILDVKKRVAVSEKSKKRQGKKQSVNAVREHSEKYLGDEEEEERVEVLTIDDEVGAIK
ncbi:hypothetical protein NDU88_002491 [Pleurodeles waltl]|uniref:Uncharacterized protein n=1 Tax=Pleurodeles waltl TaxID=8319 RepID=A0AAV7WLL4_PLEWA|nr:hypothetical protein NDU88_002491 [Pleurodeles waltl]